MNEFALGFCAGATLFFFLGLAVGWSRGWAAGWYDADKTWAQMRDKETRVHNW
jgi:hypothetical protein